jgi:hypothetical protein
MVYNSYRKTVYKTLEDPVTLKRVVEAVEYLYNKTGQVESANVRGRHIDTKA